MTGARRRAIPRLAGWGSVRGLKAHHRVGHMTHIDNATLQLFGRSTPRAAEAAIVRAAPPLLAAWSMAGLAPSELGGMAAALPPPPPPTPPIDARTLQAMESFEAEVGQVCASLERWAAAQDYANAAMVRQSGAANARSGCPILDQIHDGGMHYFMRLRMQDAHSGAAELRRLAQGSAQAQARHLEAQQASTKAAEAAAEKMKPWLAKAHILSLATHTAAVAAGCAVGVVVCVGAAGPVAALGAAALTLGLAVGGCLMLTGDRSGGLQRAATTLDVAATAGLLMMATAANPWLGLLLVTTRLVDVVAREATQVAQKHQESNMREAEALARLAREMSGVHERGYVACMDAVQRLNQSHARALGIINAMLRSSQQVNNLQIRNLRK